MNLILIQTQTNLELDPAQPQLVLFLFFIFLSLGHVSNRISNFYNDCHCFSSSRLRWCSFISISHSCHVFYIFYFLSLCFWFFLYSYKFGKSSGRVELFSLWLNFFKLSPLWAIFWCLSIAFGGPLLGQYSQPIILALSARLLTSLSKEEDRCCKLSINISRPMVKPINFSMLFAITLGSLQSTLEMFWNMICPSYPEKRWLLRNYA